MTYPELDGLDFTDAQAKGIAIANALANAERLDDPLTDGAYIAAAVQRVASSYAEQHVGAVLEARTLEEFRKAPAKDRESGEWAKRINLDVPIPALEGAVAEPLDGGGKDTPG